MGKRLLAGVQKGGDGHGVESALLQTRSFCVELRGSVGQTSISMPLREERIAVISWLFCCRTAWSQGGSDAEGAVVGFVLQLFLDRGAV